MRLFFDTETTGLPKERGARNHDVDNWPRLVQLAWVVCDDDGGRTMERSHIVKPVGFDIPEDVTKIHGITNELALRDGVKLGFVLAEFQVAVELCDSLVGHGVYFDKSVVGAEYIRKGNEYAYEALKALKRTCTMQKSTKFCELPKKKGAGFKWPKLEELHTKLFGTGFGNAHDASADIDATVKCYNELSRLGVL